MAAQYDEAAEDRNMEFESVSVSAAANLPTSSIAYGLLSILLNCDQPESTHAATLGSMIDALYSHAVSCT